MIIFTKIHMLCACFITLILTFTTMGGFSIINRVFENIGNLINGKKLKRIIPKPISSTTFSLLVVQLIVNLKKLETNDTFLMLSLLLLGGIILPCVWYSYIHNKVEKELEYHYNKREAFSIFMTLTSSILLYKWSKKCPSREDTEYAEELAMKRVGISDKLIDDILLGKYGDGLERQKTLEAKGYDYRTVQDMVTEEYYRRKEAELNSVKDTREEYKVTSKSASFKQPNTKTTKIIDKLKNEDAIISSGISEDVLRNLVEEVMEDLKNIRERT